MMQAAVSLAETDKAAFRLDEGLVYAPNPATRSIVSMHALVPPLRSVDVINCVRGLINQTSAAVASAQQRAGTMKGFEVMRS